MTEAGRALSKAEIEALFREELEGELRAHVQHAFEDGAWSSAALEIAADDAGRYRMLSQSDRHDQDLLEYAREVIADESIAQKLTSLGAPVDAGSPAAARTHLFRARAAACTRVRKLFDDDIMDAPDPVRALMANLGEPSEEVARLLAGNSRRPVMQTPPAPATDGQFLIYDNRRFGDVIEDVIAELKSEGTWKGELKQQRRIMQAFAWITGNRELGSYDHRDVANFKNGLKRLPTSFRYGTPTMGAMSRPFKDVVVELPPPAKGQQRNNKTVNRDLSTMSTVAKHLAQTAWKPRVPGAKIMDFADATIAIKESDSTILRPPWTTAHLKCLFESPIYTGGGGAKRRLKEGEPLPTVWHDAAYFAPLLWYYHHTCREEMCGLEVADIVMDHPVPHFHIRDNLTRGRDGDMAREKRPARKRTLPLHPELIRLGFLDYVKAIGAEGQAALFPELYLFEAKRGGAQFYDRSWRFMVDWIADRLPLPVNDEGKGPDIHSIRSLGSSFYEVDGVNAIMRADIMGHAREGTNGKHYSKRMQTEGLDVVLLERLHFLLRYVPIITDHLKPAPTRLLAIDQRSRVGSGRHRRIRSDAGSRKSTGSQALCQSH